MKKIYDRIATVFGIGRAKYAPGTFGSLAGLFLCLLLHEYFIAYVAFFILFFAGGVISATAAEKEHGAKDPGFVVIDEFACIFIVFLFVKITPLVIGIGFIAYRFFDIVKPPPMRLLEKLPGGWGIMIDDLAAAIYANLVLQVLTRV